MLFCSNVIGIGLGLGLDLVSGWSVVTHTCLCYFRLSHDATGSVDKSYMGCEDRSFSVNKAVDVKVGIVFMLVECRHA